MERTPLYAFSTARDLDDSFVIFHEGSSEEQYKIPVSIDRKKIAKYAERFVPEDVLSTLVDLEPLVFSGILPKNKIMSLDEL